MGCMDRTTEITSQGGFPMAPDTIIVREESNYLTVNLIDPVSGDVLFSMGQSEVAAFVEQLRRFAEFDSGGAVCPIPSFRT